MELQVEVEVQVDVEEQVEVEEEMEVWHLLQPRACMPVSTTRRHARKISSLRWPYLGRAEDKIQLKLQKVLDIFEQRELLLGILICVWQHWPTCPWGRCRARAPGPGSRCTAPTPPRTPC